MATDLYAKCPCGSGKKIKFCCRDIISDIERIERMLRGDQRTAALEKIEKLEVKYPQRPALLSMKARVYFELKRTDDAAPVVDQLLALEPDNPAGLAMRALLLLAANDVHQALRYLHRSLRMSDGVLSNVVYRAYITICVGLIERGHVIAAYAHLLTLVSVTGGEDRAGLSLLMNLTSSERLPAIFHGLALFAKCPDRVSWKREFELAIDMYRQGDWSEAAAMLEGMNTRILDEPILLRSLAILQAWTVQSEKAAKTFRHFASLRGVDLEQAAEAEACAQVLGPLSANDHVDLVAVTHDIADINELMERFLSSDMADSVPVQNQSGSDAPPPRAQFVLYDRELPKLDGELALGDLPRQYATVSLFGRETDRSARMTVVLYHDEEYSARLQRIQQLTGLQLDASSSVETLGSIHKLKRLFQADFRVPPATTLEQYNELVRQWIHAQLFDAWPRQALSSLQDRTPLEAARDPRLKITVLGAILNLELWLDRQPVEFDVNELRRKLDLPVSRPIDPSQVDLPTLSNTQLRLIELEKLRNEDLAYAFEVVALRPNGKFLYRLGQEVLRRPSMKDLLDFVEVHDRLSDLAPTLDEQLSHLQQARDLAVDRGESPAGWLVSELDLQIGRGDLESAKRLIAAIQTRYLREPGIAQQFADVLDKYGLMAQRQRSPATDSREAVGVSAEPAPLAGSERVWTPAAPPPEKEAGGGPSKIWIPD